MSITYVVVAKPGTLKDTNIQYLAYPAKLLGFRAGANEQHREVKVDWLTENHNKEFEARICLFESPHAHSERVIIVIDLDYADTHAFQADFEADICSIRWGWVRDFVSDIIQTCGATESECGGFVGGPMFLTVEGGAHHLRNRFKPMLKLV